MKLRIKDRPGAVTVKTMRGLFERMVANTERVRAETQLDTVEVKGVFSHYRHEPTDQLWQGFAIGLRMTERLAKAKKKAL